eukprot:2448333-Pleurochrysis_carterae.AAC.1
MHEKNQILQHKLRFWWSTTLQQDKESARTDSLLHITSGEEASDFNILVGTEMSDKYTSESLVGPKDRSKTSEGKILSDLSKWQRASAHAHARARCRTSQTRSLLVSPHPPSPRADKTEWSRIRLDT